MSFLIGRKLLSLRDFIFLWRAKFEENIVANNGPNKGQKLRNAYSKFASILIAEVKDIQGISNEKIDERLNICSGDAFRYSQYQIPKKSRVPLTKNIQLLENKVAALLKRPAHKVIIEINSQDVFSVGAPNQFPDLKKFDWSEIELGYEHGWPTYRSLSTGDIPLGRQPTIFELVASKTPEEDWPPMLLQYSWQWGCLWGCVPWLSKEDGSDLSDGEIMSAIHLANEAAINDRTKYGTLLRHHITELQRTMGSAAQTEMLEKYCEEHKIDRDSSRYIDMAVAFHEKVNDMMLASCDDLIRKFKLFEKVSANRL